MQRWPLEKKLDEAKKAIAAAFETSKQAVGVAFSGGKDSTVLWWILKEYFPDAEYHVIFGNTTVEFTESLRFARELGESWSNEKVHFHEVLPERLKEEGLKYEAQKEVLEWLIHEGRVQEVLKDDGKLKTTRTLEQAATPEMWEDFRERGLVWPKGRYKSYDWCCDQYGYPILGKAASKLTARRINIDCFLRFSESVTQNPETADYYNLLRHVKTSNHCCSILKKEPSEKKQTELGIDIIMKGLMAEESHSRLLSFATRGYLFEGKGRPQAKHFYHCNPLGIWRDDDIWDAIHKYDIPYSPLYDIKYKDRNGEIKHIKRNGCVGCCTDIAFPDNHMSVLRQTHPKRWEHLMTHGLGQELINLQQYEENGQLNLLSMISDPWRVLRERPCAFDEIPEMIRKDEFTESEYDAEEIEEYEQLSLF